MFRTTKVCTGLMLAFGGGLLMSGSLALAQQKLDRVEITGSAIKRVQSEGPAPVEIYTRKDIERTGATTVDELIKNIAAIDIQDQGELTSNSPSGSGTTNLRIRGLSERNVLVLLNGRRLPTNALADGSGAGAAVDVNNISLAAIERVEILKDGGSAIYGADAVAGVINFITRKNYTGLEARAGYGISSKRDAKEVPLNLVFGIGDYDTSGFNVLATLDIFKRSPIMRSDRDITRSANWSRFDNGKGFDGRSTFAPEGNIVSGAGSPGTLVPCAPADLKGGLCRFDFNKTILTSLNGADRTTGMLVGSLKLGDSMRAFAELTLSDSKDEFLAQPAPGAYVDSLGRTIRARFMQIGPRTTNRKASLQNLVAGIEGSTRGFDWDFAVGQGTSKVTNNDSNYAATDRFTAAINSGAIDPTSLTNPESEIAKFRISPVRVGKSVLQYVNGKVSGSLMELAGGPLGYAVGFSHNHETMTDTPDADQIAGNVFGSIQQAAVNASRNSSAVFGELAIPILKSVEGQVAVRYDRYPGNSKTSPKFALKYQPTSSFLVRGSYAESFLAPTLKQLYGGQDAGAESTSDPAICAAFPTISGTCDNFPYLNVGGSNPDLKPETGKTYNVGLVVEPTASTAVGVDFFMIKKKDEINTLSVESAVAQGKYAIVAGEARIFTNNQNVAATKVKGVDVDLRLRVGDTALGKVTVHNQTTYYKSIQTQFEPGDVFYEYVDTFTNPRFRNTFTVNFESGPWATTAVVRTTGGFKDSANPAQLIAAGTRRVSAMEELDLNVQYTGLKNMKLTGAIKNVLNRMPPYSNTGAQNQYGSLGFPWIYSPRGRFFQVFANYTFY